MSKAKPCPKPDCGRPKKKGKQACEWHWLLRQSSDVQAAASRLRLATYDHKDGHQDRKMRVKPEEWPDGERWCAGCQSFVPLFYARGSRCVACASSASHGAAIEKTYGITGDDYRRLMVLQQGRCAICGRVPRSRRLAVDHDHKTGAVRGLLCASGDHGCNKGLGYFNDDVEILRRAVAYLDSPPALTLRA